MLADSSGPGTSTRWNFGAKTANISTDLFSDVSTCWLAYSGCNVAGMAFDDVVRWTLGEMDLHILEDGTSVIDPAIASEANLVHRDVDPRHKEDKEECRESEEAVHVGDMMHHVK